MIILPQHCTHTHDANIERVVVKIIQIVIQQWYRQLGSKGFCKKMTLYVKA